RNWRPRTSSSGSSSRVTSNAKSDRDAQTTRRESHSFSCLNLSNGASSLDGVHRFLVHDRDGIFAPAVDEALRSMSLQVLKTPVRAPQANAHRERFIGTARRECLDWIIPLNERHLRSVLRSGFTTTTVNDHI